MGTSRKKKVVMSGVTRDEAEQAFGVYAKADAQLQKIVAEVELQCAKIREKYQEKQLALQSERDGAFDVLQSYASEHKSELFVKKKSVEMTHGVIGFRTGTPKLKTLKGFTWASALQLLKKFMPGYIRQTEEVAKDKLLSDRELKEVEFHGSVYSKLPMVRAMEECGIVVVQDETFYVEAKSED